MEDRKGKMLLEEAKAIIDARGDHYGSPIENFTRIAKLWSVVLGIDVKPYQVGLCMDLLKTARLCETPKHWDSYLDKCGYAAATVECLEVDQ